MPSSVSLNLQFYSSTLIEVSNESKPHLKKPPTRVSQSVNFETACDASQGDQRYELPIRPFNAVFIGGRTD